jgi:hypothetical protein
MVVFHFCSAYIYFVLKNINYFRVPRQRDFGKEGIALEESDALNNHPLRETVPPTVVVSNQTTKVDPLSEVVASKPFDPLSFDPLSNNNSSADPLSAPAVVVQSKTVGPSSPKEQKKEVVEEPVNTFIPWKAKKSAILQEFTTDELVGITVVCILFN